MAVSPTGRIKQALNTWASLTSLDNQACTACLWAVRSKVRFRPRETQNTISVFPLCVLSQWKKMWVYVIISLESRLVTVLYNFLSYSCSQSNVTLQPPFSSYQHRSSLWAEHWEINCTKSTKHKASACLGKVSNKLRYTAQVLYPNKM